MGVVQELLHFAEVLAAIQEQSCRGRPQRMRGLNADSRDLVRIIGIADLLHALVLEGFAVGGFAVSSFGGLRGPGRPGWLPTQAPHRSRRAR